MTVKIGVIPRVMSVAPVTVKAPVSEILPEVAVAVKSPPMLDVAKSRPASFTNVTSPSVPVVTRAIVPSTARLPMLISPLLTSLTAVRLPLTVTVPLSVMPVALPLVSFRLPPTVDAAISSCVVPPSISAFPVDPVVLNVTAPVNALVVVSRVMSSLLALVVNEEVPVIASAPSSVMEPPVEITSRLPLKVNA